MLLAQRKARVKNEISKRVTPYLISWADKIIIVADNVLMDGIFPKNKTEVWEIKDASESNPLDVSKIIDEIDLRIKGLVSRIKKHR